MNDQCELIQVCMCNIHTYIHAGVSIERDNHTQKVPESASGSEGVGSGLGCKVCMHVRIYVCMYVGICMSWEQT